MTKIYGNQKYIMMTSLIQILRESKIHYDDIIQHKFILFISIFIHIHTLRPFRCFNVNICNKTVYGRFELQLNTFKPVFNGIFIPLIIHYFPFCNHWRSAHFRLWKLPIGGNIFLSLCFFIHQNVELVSHCKLCLLCYMQKLIKTKNEQKSEYLDSSFTVCSHRHSKQYSIPLLIITANRTVRLHK